MAASIANVYLAKSNKWMPRFSDHRKPCSSTETAKRALPSDLFERIGKDRGLVVSEDISLKYRFKGYCEGASLTMISLYLHSTQPDKKSLEAAYRKNIGNVITIQKLQHQLFGLDGKCITKDLILFLDLFKGWKEKKGFDGLERPPDDLGIIYDGVLDFLNNEYEGRLREHLIQYLKREKVAMFSDLYTTILEISSCYDALLHPQKHRFHLLSLDVLQEVASLSGVACREIDAFYGNCTQVVDAICKLDEGVYHLSLPKHACVFIKEKEKKNTLWDINFGFKEISNGKKQKKQLKKWLSPAFRKNDQWLSIVQCILRSH